MESNEFDVFVREIGRLLVEGTKKKEHKEKLEAGDDDYDPNMAAISMKWAENTYGNLQPNEMNDGDLNTQFGQEKGSDRKEAEIAAMKETKIKIVRMF